MTNEPLIPLSEIREAWQNSTVSKLLIRHTPLPEPLKGSIARNGRGDEIIITSETPNDGGFVNVVNASTNKCGAYELADLTFTGERMVRIKDTPKQPESTLEAPHDDGTGLFGTWATHPDHGRGIIISFYADCDSDVKFAYTCDSKNTGSGMDYVPLDSLTLDNDHPVYLETACDYVNAPEGTIVVGEMSEPGPAESVFINEGNGQWVETGGNEFVHGAVMAGIRRRVLRWGEEK